MNDNRDDELDQLLKPLKKAAPNDLQMQKWISAAKKENKKTSAPSFFSLKQITQLAAAMFIGIVIGARIFNANIFEQSKIIAQVSIENATYERSHANLD